MKPIQFRIYYCILLTLCIIFYSCTHYIDRTRTQSTFPVDEGRMQFFPDSNTMIFKSHMKFRADTEIWPAKSFEIRFPKNIVSYDFDYGSWFIFYYKKDQVFAIWINIQNLVNQSDSIYSPSREELSTFIPSHYSYSSHNHKHNILTIPYISGRKQLIVRKKDVQILLFNIEERNIEAFKKDAETFTFLHTAL